MKNKEQIKELRIKELRQKLVKAIMKKNTKLIFNLKNLIEELTK